MAWDHPSPTSMIIINCQEDDVGEEESVAPDTDNPEVKTRPDFTFPPDIFIKQPPAEVDKAYDEGMYMYTEIFEP